jgi:hypothetical protein
MSRGPGRIERAIEVLLMNECRERPPVTEAEELARRHRPDNHATFTTSEIARWVYGHVEVLSRAQTTSVRRALANVRKRQPDWQWGRSTKRNRDLGHGSERVLYNRHSRYTHQYRG